MSYDKYERFEDRFGHLFYKAAFSHYRLVAEYRFVGDQAAGGPDWAVRNNGLMLHSQAPATMGVGQDFPISIEVQLLGGLANGKPRSTANVCTPGTQIFMNDTMVKGHCRNSTSKTYAGDDWVRVEIEVHGGDRITHVIDGQTVLEYQRADHRRRRRQRLRPGGQAGRHAPDRAATSRFKAKATRPNSARSSC